MAEQTSAQPHSASYFNAQRDFWWNQDYLQLLAKRLDLGSCREALDVGSGIGHWGRLLLPLLCNGARLTGVDPEPLWVQRAGQAAADEGLGARCRYVPGTVEELPFADAAFDLVTCQTVLMHVKDAATALAEMMRVLRPGGLLLTAEPNNRAGALVLDSATGADSVAEVVERVQFTLICERGRDLLGHGDSSVGDLLPSMFLKAGLTGLQTFLNDKTFALLPPYSSPDQRALRDAIVSDAEAGEWVWPEDDARRFFVAGGGEEHEFATRWKRRLEESRTEAGELLADRFSSAGGGIQYIVSGRRPA